ncbi:MAG: pantetheine-phosphate adenylyltransferase [Clostridia bacterium]|nr:pantetheine-phosphate adenylyltransferase [Clostridia bacterium]
MENKKKCIFAGTFDPPTLGHKNVIETCLKMFDEVVVAFPVNPTKEPYFSLSARKEMLTLMFPNESRIRFVETDGTIAELLETEGTEFYVRGLRNSTDFDYENANFYATKKLFPNVEAIYLPCPQELMHVSSSMVKNSLRFHTPIDEYVTPEVKNYIEENMKKQK